MPRTARPNLAEHLEMLSRMTPEQRLKKAFQLTESFKQAFLARLRRRFPDKSEQEIRELRPVRLMRRDLRERAIAFKLRNKDVDAG